ncbi:uncharacterized protein LOC126841248 isoform X2 [Adelges cooleyi]|uniref:uncharacterized protein LOC126841248 isoform X2 n=1 Tax=Adelges cooleyi TaxID=133065 RepID=UPI00217F78ED|nr:uncharacterized protein LOC126841248 isoform X2 [Adelges cooleyi]
MHIKINVFLCSIICIQQTLTTWSEKLSEVFGDETAPTTAQGLYDLYAAIVEKYPDQSVTQDLTQLYFDSLDQPHTAEAFVSCLQRGESELFYHTELKK